MSTTLEQTRPTHEQVALRAYQFWEQQGRPSDRDLEHWLLAEGQLLAEQRAMTESASGLKPEKPLSPPLAPLCKSAAYPPRTGARAKTANARPKPGGLPGVGARSPGSLVGTTPIACSIDGPLND
jgi:hypothetical protein